MIRSLLYVPGNTPRFLEKAASRGADAIIIDLEDAVPEAAKTAARDDLAQSVPQVGQGGAEVFVRVNMTGRLLDDAEAACRAGASGLYLPKVSGSAILEQLAAHLAPIEAETSRAPMHFVPLIEDAEGLFEARAIAKGPRVLGLSSGAEDLATSMGAKPLPEVLRLPKLMIHYAAKAAGVLSFGLFRSTVDFTDTGAIREAAKEARDHGFDGASCIHPSVVPVLNEAFAPTEAEMIWARKVLAAASEETAAGRGAFMLEGVFVDAPIVTRAERLVARFARQT
ncbi:HpcH/HpaI aldolase/citrate lyase family protein [Frigidibacter albus]|uniref:HpcH/HpaI aldolase/citrate lyase family protein n=1 Tax=Frigidibacter albus TaxID=1465486 RepID=A0A6L8VG76_9RHOB|nr:CoA ester lyase [Frigidibacter albus]MZQ89174.1 HpcH/HpaI aldolase/citrate lyase family protein [Frigidibacter albus]NBE30769.1 HpcH/HpaI aldolase/citrate lyase family protein [Frigidibacter albus]GGH50950.1 CoA ester lyase [Frigidibacter albus]